MTCSGKPARWASVLMVGPAALFGQTLALSPVTAAPGEFAVIQMSLSSAAGHQPVALQWDAVVPALLELQSDRIMRLTVAAQDAGKSLTCGRAQAAVGAQTVRCLLSGGQKPIPEGTIAILSLRVRETAPPGPVTVRFEQATAVDRDAKASPVDPVETTVTVRAR